MCGELLGELFRHDSFTDQLSIAIAVLIPPQAIAIAIVKCTLKYTFNVNVNSALMLHLIVGAALIKKKNCPKLKFEVGIL